MPEHENFISVDVETAGPIPGEYSMLSIGACPLHAPDDGFYVELQPINDNAVPDALRVTGFSLDKLRTTGMAPPEAMARFAAWLKGQAANGDPILVGFNVGFDWSFVNWYFHKFTGSNPFGYTSLDIKSYYMGLAGCSWSDTRSSRIPDRFQPKAEATHNALDDARAQAEMLSAMLLSKPSH